MFTGKGREEVAVRAWSLGGDHYVNKTGDPETVYCELAHCLRSTVEKRFAEAQMKETVQKLQTIYQNAVEGITYVDAEENIVFANKAFADIVGYEQDQLAGMNLRRIVDDENWAKIESEMEHRRQGESSRYEAELRRRDGTVRNVQISGAPLLDSNGRFVGTSGIVLDITEQKKTREAIKQSEKRFKSIFESVDDGLVYLDASGRIIEVNRKAVEIFGGSKEELLGKHFTNIGVLSLKEVPAFTKRFMDILRGKEAFLDVTIKNKKGQAIPLECSASISKAYGKTTIAVVARDMTEHRERERLLKESEEKYRGLFENARDVIVLLDLKGNVISVNKAAEEYGFNKSEILGKNMLKFVSKRYWPKLLKDVAQNALGKTAKGRIEIHTPKGDKMGEYRSNPIFSHDRVVGIQTILEDTTESKKAEEALRESEEKYKDLFENAMDAILTLDLKGSITAANNSVLRFGYKKEDLVGKNVLDFVSKEYWSAVTKDFSKVAQGESAKNEIELAAPAGKIIVEYHARAIVKENNVAGVQINIRDVTERKKAEESVRAREERYRSCIEVTGQLGWTTNANGEVEEDVPAWRKYTGQSYEEAKGWGWMKAIHPDDLEHAEQAWEKAVAEKSSYEVEYRMRRYDGVYRYFMARGVPVLEKDGKIREWVGTCIDITERKKTEQTLKESEEKHRSLVELAPDGIVAVNAEGVVTSVNRSFLTLVGYDTEEEIVGKPFTKLMTMRMEDIPRFQGMFESLMKGESTSPSEFLYVRRDGTSRWAEVHPGLLIKGGKPVGVQAAIIDITERKKTEEKLRNSEERLSILFELAPDAYYLSDLKGNFIDGNKAAEKLTGYMKDELIGKSFLKLKLLPRNEVLKAAKLLAMNALGKSTGPDELVLNRKDGTQVPVEIRTHPIKIKDKNLVLGIARDITTRKKDEQAIRESYQKFEGLFRRNPEAAVHLDVNFKIVNVNPRFCQLFSYSAEEAKGRNINDVIVPEGMREEAEGLDKDAKNGYASHDTVRKRKDGSLVPVSISAAPVTFENKLLGYVGIYKDITELKRAQEESEESKRHFQMLFDLMADPVAVVDGGGKILEVTRKVEEITGFKREELVGKKMRIKMFGAKTKAVMIKSLAKRMMGMNMQPYEVEVLKKDGGKLVYEINAAKIDYKGKPADLVVFRDILKRKNLEEKLRVVGSLTRHDVRNKLSAVTGNAYLLRRKLAGNPEALEQLADMEAAVRKVEAIFEFARTYEKLGVEQLTNVNVGKTVDEAASLFPDLKGVRIANECGGLTVLADSLLRQLFYNLIDNALKYGEKLTQIRVRYEESEDKLKLIYEDDGVGISRDAKSKIFNEGFTTGKGSGYGLYLIRRMMEIYGWTISETGTHGKGAQFTIDIPKAKPDGRQNYRLS
jgi:PAS domain S-box-containing protein